MSGNDQAKSDAILKLGRNRVLAHATLFRHRHPDDTPHFHPLIINAWHSALPKSLTMAFRGGAKSTIAEEVITIEAIFGLFKFAMLLGESRDRAVERLSAIKHEIDTNDNIQALFGNLHGSVWNEDEVILGNGVRIMAFGMEQSLRGVKHHSARPDRLYGDDLESEETVKTPEAREKFALKFMRVVLPLLDPKARVRLLGTPLDRDAFLVKLAALPEWNAMQFPIEYVAQNGERTATWPSRFPLEKIDEIKRDYANIGQLHSFMQEYMLQPEDMGMKKFNAGMIKVEPLVHSWHPTVAVYDPARTVNQKSATTGHVVASWIGSKLVIWEGDGRFIMPDAIIDDMFRVQLKYHPIMFGVEADGLNEFILQPLRQAQTVRRELLPITVLKAPKGKISFIESLQPFFKAGEIVFAQPLPELEKQLLSFPTGRIDAPNALAYFLVLRPGMPIFEGFGFGNVVDQLHIVSNARVFLACNHDGAHTTAVLAQFVDGSLRLLADWVREGAALGDIWREAHLLAPKISMVMPARHWREFNTLGLLPMANKLQAQPTTGGLEASGREEIRQRMRQVVRDQPAVLINSSAHWVLNAFAGGYCRAIQKNAVLSEFAADGVYKTLCEGLESFTALLQTVRDEGTSAPHYAYTAGGVRYMTALPQRDGGNAWTTKKML